MVLRVLNALQVLHRGKILRLCPTTGRSRPTSSVAGIRLEEGRRMI